MYISSSLINVNINIHDKVKFILPRKSLTFPLSKEHCNHSYSSSAAHAHSVSYVMYLRVYKVNDIAQLRKFNIS